MEDYSDFDELYQKIMNCVKNQPDTPEDDAPEGRQQLRSRSPQYADKTKKHINT